MKRLGALLGAVAMVAAAFVVRGALDDDAAGTGGSGARSDAGGLLCAAELADVCGSVDPDSTTAIAGATADDLMAATDARQLGADAWIVPRAWAELVIAERSRLGSAPLFEVAGDPLASSPIVLAIWADRAEELGGICTAVDWACLAGRTGTALTGNHRVAAGSPEVDSATGLTVAAAQAAGLLGTDDFAFNDFDDQFRTLAARLARGQTSGPLLSMRLEGPGRLTAAGVVAADATNLSSTFGTIVPIFDLTPAVRADLVALVPIGSGLDGELRTALTDAFGDAGWDPPADGPDGLPAGGVLAAIRTLWNESR